MPVLTNTHFAVIIPAAGIGSRMAANTAKQYLRIADKTILEHTLEVFLAHHLIDQVIVVLHPTDTLFVNLAISGDPKIKTITGGRERVDSVLAGLRYLLTTRDRDDFVLIHDAARPCIQPEDITRLIESCCSNGAVLEASGAVHQACGAVNQACGAVNQASGAVNQACGAILACPITDTVKQAYAKKTSGELGVDPVAKPSVSASIIHKTIDRSLLWQAQTPQMFKLESLTSAIENGLKNGEPITDEAFAMEAAGKRVLLVEGPSSNIKVTKPADLALASFYLLSAKTPSTDTSVTTNKAQK